MVNKPKNCYTELVRRDGFLFFLTVFRSICYDSAVTTQSFQGVPRGAVTIKTTRASYLLPFSPSMFRLFPPPSPRHVIPHQTPLVSITPGPAPFQGKPIPATGMLLHTNTQAYFPGHVIEHQTTPPPTSGMLLRTKPGHSAPQAWHAVPFPCYSVPMPQTEKPRCGVLRNIKETSFCVPSPQKHQLHWFSLS
jgi:hypothetical protein